MKASNGTFIDGGSESQNAATAPDDVVRKDNFSAAAA